VSVAVAVRRDDTVALATDSMIHFGGEKVPPDNLADRKMRPVGSAWLASTGWSLYANILDDVLADRRRQPRLVDARSIFRFFNDLWRDLHERYSFVRDQPDSHDSPFGELDASFLVVCAGGIFHVASDLAVSPFHRYFAIGSGAPLAIGALHVLQEAGLDAPTAATRAVEAACAHDLYCGGPVNIESVRASQ